MDVRRMRSRSVTGVTPFPELLVLYGRLPMGTFDVHARPDGMAIAARGATLPDLFEAAAEGLCAAVVEAASVEHRVWLERVVSADTVPGLMTAWLNGVMVLLAVEEFMPRTFVIDDMTGLKLRATVHGEPIDASRHRAKVAASSVSVTVDRVSHGAGGWSARVAVEVPAERSRR